MCLGGWVGTSHSCSGSPPLNLSTLLHCKGAASGSWEIRGELPRLQLLGEARLGVGSHREWNFPLLAAGPRVCLQSWQWTPLLAGAAFSPFCAVKCSVPVTCLVEGGQDPGVGFVVRVCDACVLRRGVCVCATVCACMCAICVQSPVDFRILGHSA